MSVELANVAALYVDPRGPYPGLVREWYDERRDARTYRGRLPVVAHPPCGPWGKLRHLHRRTEEAALAPHAVAVVRRFGGVLEHPAGSLLWGFMGLPLPLAPPDEFGGQTIEVCQCDWGHPARKRTWLYAVGVPRWPSVTLPVAREPTHWISGGRNCKTGGSVPAGIKVCSAQQRRRTPVGFAKWLVWHAESVTAARQVTS